MILDDCLCPLCSSQDEKGTLTMEIKPIGTLLSDVEPKDETHEQVYRRAYRDGWIQALNAIGEMMFERKISRDKAHLACWNHWEETLFEWERCAGDPQAGFEVPSQP